jgi:hypothetical protein
MTPTQGCSPRKGGGGRKVHVPPESIDRIWGPPTFYTVVSGADYPEVKHQELVAGLSPLSSVKVKKDAVILPLTHTYS